MLNVSSLDELKFAISSVASKLTEGEAGVEKIIGLLICLTPFPPAPSTFGRDGFDDVVAFDYETGVHLPKEDQQKMLEFALAEGLIQRADTHRERYSVRQELLEVVTRFLGEE